MLYLAPLHALRRSRAYRKFTIGGPIRVPILKKLPAPERRFFSSEIRLPGKLNNDRQRLRDVQTRLTLNYKSVLPENLCTINLCARRVFFQAFLIYLYPR